MRADLTQYCPFKTAIVSINQLPETEETLWLRILGRDATQAQAIAEVLALPAASPQRRRILQMLVSWKVRIEITESLESEDETLLMALSQAYLDWEKATEERGEKRGEERGEKRGEERGEKRGEERGERKVVEAMLKARFGELDEPLVAIVPQILSLSAEDYTVLILQLSRQELLERFA